MDDKNETSVQKTQINQPKKDDSSAGKAIACIFVIGIIFMFLVILIKSNIDGDGARKNPASGSISTTDERRYYATGLAKKHVEKELKYPASSTFQPESEMTVTFDASTHKYTVKGYVDAANAFGTKERKYFTVTMEIRENDGKVYSSNVVVSI